MRCIYGANDIAVATNELLHVTTYYKDILVWVAKMILELGITLYGVESSCIKWPNGKKSDRDFEREIDIQASYPYLTSKINIIKRA